ncbi:unnamed protein product [Lepidochelys olivacea]
MFYVFVVRDFLSLWSLFHSILPLFRFPSHFKSDLFYVMGQINIHLALYFSGGTGRVAKVSLHHTFIPPILVGLGDAHSVHGANLHLTANSTKELFYEPGIAEMP